MRRDHFTRLGLEPASVQLDRGVDLDYRMRRPRIVRLDSLGLGQVGCCVELGFARLMGYEDDLGHWVSLVFVDH